MAEVSIIRQIGRSFWSNVDGSIDAGFSYTRSSGVAQLNLNWATEHRQPAARSRLMASVTLTRTDDDADRDDRASVEASYLRYPWRRWFVAAAGRFETNESLGLELRSQIGAASGPRLINTNRAQLAMGAGLVFNDERGVDVEPTQNVEALLMFQTSYFTYDRPKTNLDISLQVLSQPEQCRPPPRAARRRRQARALQRLLRRAHALQLVRQSPAKPRGRPERRRSRRVARLVLLSLSDTKRIPAWYVSKGVS